MRTEQPVTLTAVSRPRLATHLRLHFDAVRGQYVLLGPESVSVLNRTGADILRLCDGRRSVAEVDDELRGLYGRVPDDEVLEFLTRLYADGSLEIENG